MGIFKKHKNGKEKIMDSIIDVNDFIEKNKNKKIVFTNGVFDMVHKGHIEVLEYSKSLGDILIVGINSDISVKMIKGENRPIMDLNNRVAVLKSIKYVDFVIPFDEKSPVELIEKINKIDIYVKGGDYNLNNLPEREVLEKKNTEIRFFNFKTKISTTEIVKKITQNFCK